MNYIGGNDLIFREGGLEKSGKMDQKLSIFSHSTIILLHYEKL